jgi:hypothetical protein
MFGALLRPSMSAEDPQYGSLTVISSRPPEHQRQCPNNFIRAIWPGCALRIFCNQDWQSAMSFSGRCSGVLQHLFDGVRQVVALLAARVNAQIRAARAAKLQAVQ